MSQPRANAISFICGILAIILAFNAYNDITAGAIAHDTVSIVVGYIKIVIAIVLSFVFVIFKSKAAK